VSSSSAGRSSAELSALVERLRRANTGLREVVDGQAARLEAQAVRLSVQAEQLIAQAGQLSVQARDRSDLGEIICPRGLGYAASSTGPSWWVKSGYHRSESGTVVSSGERDTGLDLGPSRGLTSS